MEEEILADQNTKMKIVANLLDAVEWRTSKAIAEALGISVRNVKYSVADLNSEYPDLIRSSAKGYAIDKTRAGEILSNIEVSSIPRNYQERKKQLITTLLVQGQRVSMDDLADMLAISVITLSNEITRLRSELAEFHLTIRTKNDIVSIAGSNKDKRDAVMHLVNDEIKENRFSNDTLQQIFTTVDIETIEDIVLDALHAHEYFLDDYALLNYCLHLGLTVEINGTVEEPNRYHINEPSLRSLVDPEVRAIVEDIYSKLKEHYSTPYTLSDIYQASVLMMTRAVTSQTSAISYDQLEAVIGPEVNSLLDEIVASIAATYGLHIDDNPDFMIRFAFHLRNLLLRLRMGIGITNLQFREIKTEYPFMYAIAVHISRTIQQNTGLQLPEDEIAYIALHIGVMIQEQQAIHNRVTCILVCPDYIQLSKEIFRRINRTCTDSLLISNIYTSVDHNTDLSGIDLIITTNQIRDVAVRQLIINRFPTETDFRNIFLTVDALKQEKINNRLRDKILYFFHEDLFFVDENLPDETAAIDFICGKMSEGGYVEPDFRDKIYEHEKIASSSYGRVAIAHPLGNNSDNSVIAVSINNDPIKWGINEVKLAVVFTLKESDSDLFQDIFAFLSRCIHDEATFQEIMLCKSFDDFISIMIRSGIQ